MQKLVAKASTGEETKILMVAYYKISLEWGLLFMQQLNTQMLAHMF